MSNELIYQSIFKGAQMDERLTAVARLQEALAAVEQAITAKYTKPASGIPETDLDEAVQSALAKARSAVQDLSNYYTKTEIDALLSAVNSQQYVDVTALPAASADTLGKIYLVGPDAYNQFARYYTSYDGSTYSWVAAGTTEINLALYATKEELSQLSQDVDEIGANFDEVKVLSNNILAPSLIVAKTGFIRGTNGVTIDSGYYGYTDFIEIPEEGIYTNTFLARGGSYRCGILYYDANKTFLGYKQENSITRSDYTGAVYVRINLGNPDVFKPGGEFAGQDYALYKGTHQKDYDEYKIGRPLSENTVSFESLQFKMKETGKNKLNPNAVTNDAYINQTNGRVISISRDNPVSVTGFIPVSVDGLFFNNGTTFGTYAGSAVYDENKNYIRSSYSNRYIYQEGDAFVRFTFITNTLPTGQVEVGDHATEYEPYSEREVINPDYLPTPDNDDSDRALKVFLPKRIYAVVGDTLQIFFQSLVRSVDVLSQYNVRVSCSKGRQFHRYFEYTPAVSDIGTVTFRIDVADDFGYALGSASCDLVTVDTVTSPSNTKKVVCIGASTTANGIWPAETLRRLTGEGGTPEGKELSNIVFCGPQRRDGAGYLGKSGWGWADYCTERRPAFRFTISPDANVTIGNVYSHNGHTYTVIEVSDDNTIRCSTSSASNVPLASGTLTLESGAGDNSVPFSASSTDSQNPFWDHENDKLTFVPFADTYCGGTIDAIYIWVGANGLANWQNEFADYYGYMQTFAETLHTEFPSAKLFLLLGTVPSMKLMMPGYGAKGSGWADTYGMVDSFFNLRAFYQKFADREEYADFVEYIDGVSQFDSDYNMPLTQKAVNTRNANFTEPYANNTVHPGTPGYMQVADSVFRHFVANFCQS